MIRILDIAPGSIVTPKSLSLLMATSLAFRMESPSSLSSVISGTSALKSSASEETAGQDWAGDPPLIPAADPFYYPQH